MSDTPTAFKLGRVLFEARTMEAWGSHGPHIIARTPWPKHPAADRAEGHIMAIAEAKALLAVYDVRRRQDA